MTIVIKSTEAPDKLLKGTLFNGRPNNLFIKYIFMHSEQQ